MFLKKWFSNVDKIAVIATVLAITIVLGGISLLICGFVFLGFWATVGIIILGLFALVALFGVIYAIAWLAAVINDLLNEFFG